MNTWQIKEMRFKLNMTQAEFAKHIKVSLGAVRTWERGACKPNERTLYKLEQLNKDLV